MPHRRPPEAKKKNVGNVIDSQGDRIFIVCKYGMFMVVFGCRECREQGNGYRHGCDA